MSLLIRNTTAILTGMAGNEARHKGPDIRIEGGRIASIGSLTPEPGEEQIDAGGCVVYPAWVNTHHHLFQSLLKGDPQGVNATLTPWLSATPFRLRPGMDEGMFRLAARIGLVELALSGCGTVADHNYHYWPGMPYDSSAILFEEASALGLRFVLCRGGGTLSRIQADDLPPALRPETLDGYLADIERLAARFHDSTADGMRRVVVAPTTPPHSMRPQELRECAAVARKLGLRLHSHLSETVHYHDTVHAQHGIKPIHFAQSIDWLGEDVWFAHLVKLDADEIELLGSTHTGIAHCPQSNGRLGSGIAPVRALEDAGATVSIGVDGAASNEAADMISEVHSAWLMQRARAGEAAVALHRGGKGENEAAAAATVEDVVRWGTAGGAKVLGLSAVGTIAPGQAADLAIYAVDRDPRYFGLHDPAIGPVASGGAAHLRALLVGGHEVVREGAIKGLDLQQLGRDARAAVAKLQR
ncbi:MAG: amidohydrolase family protein [Burkholderiales bacterium]|nr:amidohydrolase family protein [Burkholderiales bacterium]